MSVYRIVPREGASVLRHAGNLAKATRNGQREFPAGLQSVEVVSLTELAQLAAEGVPLPVVARQRLQVHKAVQREKAKAAAKIEAIRDKAREKAQAKRQEEGAQREALKAQQKAEKAAERKRKATAERRAKAKAEKQRQQAISLTLGAGPQAPALPLMVDASDTRLPWQD